MACSLASPTAAWEHRVDGDGERIPVKSAVSYDVWQWNLAVAIVPDRLFVRLRYELSVQSFAGFVVDFLIDSLLCSPPCDRFEGRKGAFLIQQMPHTLLHLNRWNRLSQAPYLELPPGAACATLAASCLSARFDFSSSQKVHVRVPSSEIPILEHRNGKQQA